MIPFLYKQEFLTSLVNPGYFKVLVHDQDSAVNLIKNILQQQDHILVSSFIQDILGF